MSELTAEVVNGQLYLPARGIVEHLAGIAAAYSGIDPLVLLSQGKTPGAVVWEITEALADALDVAVKRPS